jgi:hypothetical protein
MADPLYFSVWFPDFDEADMLPHAISVMKQLPFSQQRPGITYLSLHPVSWSEATVLERRFTPGIAPEEAAAIANDLLHDDYAYVFEGHWDLWVLDGNMRQWSLQACPVRFVVQGPEFEEQTAAETGHIQIDFDLDSPFLLETDSLTPEGEDRIRINIQKLVEFTVKVEKNTGATGRLLWSESEENLAQKLIARLQKIQ